MEIYFYYISAKALPIFMSVAWFTFPYNLHFFRFSAKKNIGESLLKLYFFTYFHLYPFIFFIIYLQVYYALALDFFASNHKS